MSDYDGTRSTIDNNFRCLMKFPGETANFPFVDLRTFEAVVFAGQVERLLSDTYRRLHPNGKVHKATA